ncbi:polyprotein [Gossypium australe]|uniref:Polyprotein n=1 Tax=Gossypium australe TaxID=47621 RepID=A0A5B6X1D5_9ROSI|nr:polyprotein [Gossypium australe]
MKKEIVEHVAKFPLDYFSLSRFLSGRVRIDWSLPNLTEVRIHEMVGLYGVPACIISDQDSRFTSSFLKKLHESWGTRLNFSTTFHPQSDGQSERVIQILEDMLCACVIYFEFGLECYLPLAEFVYNNNFQSSIQIAPYEEYGQRCRTPVCWAELSERRSYTELKWRDVEYLVGDKVFLKVSPWKKGKLSPRFIGPYEIIERVGPVAYRLALPPELQKIHDVFHMSMLK